MTREAFIAQYMESGENFKVMPLADGLLYYAEPWTDACFEGPDPTCPSPASSPNTKQAHACHGGHQKVRRFIESHGYEVAEDFHMDGAKTPHLHDYAYGVSVFFLRDATPPGNVLLPEAYWNWAGRQPSDRRYAPKRHIAALAPQEVFVFGSNAAGFHGAGSAGWAYTGKPGNQYRANNPLLKRPNGTKGFWAVLGCAKGYQEGTDGRSFAICTITRPGAKRSTPLESIRQQVQALYSFARAHPDLTFFVTKSGESGKPSLNGYALEENARCFLSSAP
jgi:hypothetical protein